MISGDVQDNVNPWCDNLCILVPLCLLNSRCSSLSQSLHISFSLVFLQPKLLHRVVYTHCVHCLTPVHSVTHSEPEPCFTTPLSLLSAQHGGFTITSMLTDSMDTFSSSLPLTLWAVFYLTSHFLFLGTLSSWPLVFSWLLLIFFAGSSSPKHLHIVVSWDQSSYNLSWRHFSCSMISPNKSQQNSHIYISFEFWTYLIPPLGFLIGTL